MIGVTDLKQVGKTHTWHNLQIYLRQEIVSHTCLTWRERGGRGAEVNQPKKNEVQECWRKLVAGACDRKLKLKEESEDLPGEDMLCTSAFILGYRMHDCVNKDNVRLSCLV